MRIQHRVRASHVSPWDRAPFVAFDPDADRDDWEHPREGQTPDELWGEDDDDASDDEREVPVPFQNVCPDCSGYKHSDNAVCDDCNDKLGVEDHQ